MAIDASIYNLLAQPRKSAFDYANEYEQQDANRLAQAQARQLNALQIGAAQDQATERQRTLAEDQAWRDFMGSGADLRTPQGLSAGMKVSPSRVQAWQAADLAAREKQSVIDKNKAATDKDLFDLDNKRTDLALMTGLTGRTPSAIKALISQGVSKKLLSMQQATEILSDLPTDEQVAADPSLLKRWRMQAIEHGLDRKDYLANEWKRQEAERAAKNDALTAANKPFTVGPNGEVVPNQAVQAYEMGRAKNSAANVNVKLEAKLGEGLAKEVGPMISNSATAAEGAYGQLQTARQIIGAIDSGKVIAGPGASWRLGAKQLAQTIGVGGRDDAEAIAKTREVIQGMAQSIVNARKQLAGQGQVSDSEQKLLERATSGGIDELTGPEIRLLAQVNERLSRQVIQRHNTKLQKLKADPAVSGLATYFEAIPLDDQPSAPAGAASGAGNVIRYDANGKRLP